MKEMAKLMAGDNVIGDLSPTVTTFKEIMKKVQNNLSKLSDEELQNRMDDALNSDFYHLVLNENLYASEICTNKSITSECQKANIKEPT